MKGFRNLTRFFGVALALLALSACGGGDGAAPVRITSIRFVTQPSDTVLAGAPFSVSVELVDDAGARAVGGKDTVALAISAPGQLGGTVSVKAVDGLATFTGISGTTVGAGFTLTAHSKLLTATSTPFRIKSGPPVLAQSSISPNGRTGVPFQIDGITFAFKDAHGNPVAGAPVALSITAPGQIGPDSGTTTAAGGFVGAFRLTSVGSATITATVDGVALNFPASFIAADLCPQAAMTFPGTLSASIPAAQCVLDGLPSVLHQFTAPAGGFGLTVTSTAVQPVFEVRSTQYFPGVPVFAQATPITWEWLVAAGTYTLRLSAATGQGAVSVVSAPAPANTGCVFNRVIVGGGAFTGQNLVMGDCDIYDDGTFADAFYFRDERPCTITMQPTGFEPYLDIIDPTSNPATGIDFAHPTGAQPAIVTLPSCTNLTGGPILMIANNYNPGPAGAYTLTIALQGSVPQAPLARMSGTTGAALRTRNATAPLRVAPGPLRLRRR